MKVKSESEVAQSCSTLSDPMDCNLPRSSVHGIFQARVLEWGAIAFSEFQFKCHLFRELSHVHPKQEATTLLSSNFNSLWNRNRQHLWLSDSSFFPVSSLIFSPSPRGQKHKLHNHKRIKNLLSLNLLTILVPWTFNKTCWGICSVNSNCRING